MLNNPAQHDPLQAQDYASRQGDSRPVAVAAHIVGDRPDRFAPRRVKRRPQHYLRLQNYRHVYTSRDVPSR
jgi:hypothetical protein